MTIIHYTVDGCTPDTNHLHYLEQFKSNFPSFKATIFCSILKCTTTYLDQLASLGYLEIACFGLNGSGREMAWFRNKEHLQAKMNYMESQFSGHYIKGFKAPQFAYTQDAYEELRNRGYWIIEHQYNKNALLSGVQFFQYHQQIDTLYFDGHAKNNGFDGRGIDQSYNSCNEQFSNLTSLDFRYVSESLETS